MSTSILYRIAAAHIVYLVLIGIGVLCLMPAPGWVETFICSLPVFLSVGLAYTSTADHEQYMMRLLAAALFLPVLLLFWCQGDGVSVAYSLSLGLLHILCFVGSIFWLGTRTTRMAAARGVPPVDATTLQARLLSLDKIGGPFGVTSPAAGEVIVVYRSPLPDRSYRVLLNLDAAKGQVRVRERCSANLATPTTSNERSMRGPGEPAYDPSRPTAQAILETVAQVTPIREAELVAVPLTWQGPAAAVPAGFAGALDERGLATLLCAAVTRSGWHWQPGFFGAK